MHRQDPQSGNAAPIQQGYNPAMSKFKVKRVEVE
jgi:hypothetical protein